MKNLAQKQTKTKEKEFVEKNILTANIGHPSIAKSIMEEILIECGYDVTVVDCLAMLIEGFKNKESLVDVIDHADELQRELFQYSIEYSGAVKNYITNVRGNKR